MNRVGRLLAPLYVAAVTALGVLGQDWIDLGVAELDNPGRTLWRKAIALVVLLLAAIAASAIKHRVQLGRVLGSLRDGKESWPATVLRLLDRVADAEVLKRENRELREQLAAAEKRADDLQVRVELLERLVPKRERANTEAIADAVVRKLQGPVHPADREHAEELRRMAEAAQERYRAFSRQHGIPLEEPPPPPVDEPTALLAPNAGDAVPERTPVPDPAPREKSATVASVEGEPSSGTFRG